MKLYDGRKALVTGAASGIGKNLVQHLVDNGARVICCDVNAAAGQSVVEALNATKGSPVAFFVKVDVTIWDEVDAAFSQAQELLGSKLDYVFANAGIQKVGSFPSDTRGKPDMSVLDVNATGVFYTIQAAINHFRHYRSGGMIVATASIAGYYPLRPDPIYTASKHAVVGLVRAAALRTSKEKIFINAVAPPSTASGMVSQKLMEEMIARGLGTTMSNVLDAFKLFLAPDCRLTGKIAEPMGGRVSIVKFPVPPTFEEKPKPRL